MKYCFLIVVPRLERSCILSVCIQSIEGLLQFYGNNCLVGNKVIDPGGLEDEQIWTTFPLKTRPLRV